MKLETGRRVGRAILVGAAAVALLLAAWWGLTRDLRAGERDAELVFSELPLARGALRHTVVATGTVEPLARVLVKSEVSSVVRAVHVEEGDRVEAGQPLFELDRERLAQRAAKLEAALEMRRAEAQRDLAGRAQLELEQRRRDRDRLAELHERGVASSLELEHADHALRLALVDLTDARAESAARRAAVSAAEAELRGARRDLEQAVIRAPIDGIVLERSVELGSVVADVTSSGGTLLAIVADDVRIRLIAEVDENDIARVRVGQDVDVRFDAFPGEELAGAVRKVSSSGTVEENVANFEIEVELPPDPRIRVGMSADARVVVKRYDDVLLVPNRAIVQGGDGPSVRIQDASAARGVRQLRIREVYSDGFQTVIEDGGPAPGDVLLVPDDGMRG